MYSRIRDYHKRLLKPSCENLILLQLNNEQECSLAVQIESKERKVWVHDQLFSGLVESILQMW